MQEFDSIDDHFAARARLLAEDPAARLDAMRHCSFFQPVPDEWLRRISEMAQVRTFAGDTCITSQDDEMTAFYVILYGSAEAFRNGKLVGAIETGDCFGEGIFFTDGTITTSATVISDDKIIGHESNLWAMGPTGPCGYCSEIFYDQGPSVAGGPPGSPEEDGDRFVEITQQSLQVDDAYAACAKIKAAGGNVAGALDFVGSESSVALSTGVVRRGGQVVIVGLFGGELRPALSAFTARIRREGGLDGERGHDGRLADAALAGEQEEPAIEQVTQWILSRGHEAGEVAQVGGDDKRAAANGRVMSAMARRSTHMRGASAGLRSDPHGRPGRTGPPT